MVIHPLKKYREEKGLTQDQLATILSVSDATITHIENGRRRVTPENARDWEKILGIPRSVLCPEVFDKDWPHPDGRPLVDHTAKRAA